MAHDALAVANYLLQKANEDQSSLTPMQMIKMVYMAHGWSLALLNRPLIQDMVEAWQYGPVIASVYHEFKKYGSEPILEPATTLDADFINGEFTIFKREYSSDFNVEEKEIMDAVYENYSRFTGIQLSRLTHQPDTPWSEAWKTAQEHNKKAVEIPDPKIEEHFKALAEKTGTTMSNANE